MTIAQGSTGNTEEVRAESEAVQENIPEPAPRFSQSEDRFFLILAVFIGIISGATVVCFRVAIEYSRLRWLGSSLYPSGARLFLAPILVGIAVAALILWVFPGVRGSGVNQTKAALYIYDGRIPFRTAIGKFLTSALAIGSGQSLGPEDPSLQIGASIASAIGRRLRLSREKLRLVAPVGAAAGLAAAFNAPISAVLFVIEEVVGRWTAGILGAVVLSAVSSVVVARWFLGAEPMFHIPPVEIRQPAELIAYAVLGVAGALASLVFAWGIDYLRPKLKAMPRWTQLWQPAIAGGLIALIAYAGFPQVMGAGYNFMDLAMHDQFTWQMLGLLVAFKILATTLSFVSGAPGGMFAPTLFIGAMLGGAVGGIERLFFPHHVGPVGTYALVGMGVMFAGFLRAPMTSAFMVLEVSGNYSVIIPVIVANTIAYVLSRTLQPVPIFEKLTRQDGLELPSMEEVREEVILRVEDAMRPPGTAVLNLDELLPSAVGRVRASQQEEMIFVQGDRSWFLVPLPELRAGMLSRPATSQVRDAISALPLPHVFPDHPLETALKYLQKFPLLPVVHRADPMRLVGTISMPEVVRAYQKAAEEESVQSSLRD